MFFFYKNGQMLGVYENIDKVREQLVSIVKDGTEGQFIAVEGQVNQMLGDISNPVLSYTYEPVKSDPKKSANKPKETRESKPKEPEPEPEEEKSEHEEEKSEAKSEEKSEHEEEEEAPKKSKKSSSSKKSSRSSRNKKEKKDDSDSE